MFANYLKTALRNLLRNKLFSLINIAGLAIGLAAFILITLFVRDEFSWDSHWDGAGDIYHLENTYTRPEQPDRPSPNAVDPLKDIFLETFREVEDITRYMDAEVTIRKEGELFSQRALFADDNLFAFFGFNFIEGSPEAALSQLSNVVISERTAQKYFADQAALGKPISFRVGGEFRDFYVSGVVENPRDNSVVVHDFIVPFNREYFVGARWFTEDWRFALRQTFVRFAAGTNMAMIRAELPGLVERHLPKGQDGMETGRTWSMVLSLVGIEDVHLYGNGSNGDPDVLYGFLAVALLILVIAVVNFLNLSMARTAHRAREVSMRKVLGASRSQILQQFLCESVLLSLISLVIALALVELALPYYNEFLSSLVQMDLMGDPALLAALLALGIGVGLSAGSLHAGYFAMLAPRDVLYSNTSPDAGTAGLRAGLVVAQFSISVALMIIAFFVNQQTDYARQLDLGFEADDLIVVSGANGDQSETFKQRLLASPYVTSVGRSSDVPTEGSEDRLNIRPLTGGEPVMLDGLPIGPDFFKAYQIKLLAGRYLSDSAADILRKREANPTYKESANIVINAAGAKMLGFQTPDEAIGQVMPTDLSSNLRIGATIVGVVDDFHFDSARDVIRPGIYYVDQLRQSDMSVRIDGANREAAIAHIETAWRETFPDSLLNYRVMTDMVAQQYQTDNRLGNILTVFTTLAVAISCMGLYGLASFTAERRTKEIGIRKVLGAGFSDIIRLLLWQFSKPILFANLLAWPAAFYFLNDWLNSFAYRIDLAVLPFFLIGALALAVGWLTVIGHAWLVARSNPITALRHE
ncbi:ABC transporter permease [Kordiimonas sp.]|uniref:ABC transporter permease n=1 Tax=Kordiimonas sp. TaxID=1970157 RepID=UPI003A904FA0